MIRPAAWVRQAFTFVRTQPYYWREAWLCAPAMPLLLLAGFFTGHVADGAIAAGAAFTVGFGSARRFAGRRWAAMIYAMVGTTLAALIGSLSGQAPVALVIVSALAGTACAVLALLHEGLWWITLQVVITLLVAGDFPGPPIWALHRAAAVFVGGAVQAIIVVVLAKIAPNASRPLPPAPPLAPPSGPLLISHALRAAVCVSVSWVLAHALGLANAYWAPMTAMLVLKPGLSETHTRGYARVAGTVAGAGGATLLAVCTEGSPLWMLIGAGLAAAASFAVQKAHYAILTAAVTATVVLLLTLAHAGSALANAEHRLIATALGGAVALIVARIAPHRPLSAHPEPDRA